jgi:hypothetical protein
LQASGRLFKARSPPLKLKGGGQTKTFAEKTASTTLKTGLNDSNHLIELFLPPQNTRRLPHLGKDCKRFSSLKMKKSGKTGITPRLKEAIVVALLVLTLIFILSSIF